jgi:hypothetical protein
MGVESPIEETYWTPKEWSAHTRIPYRTILAAVGRGELAAVRPSGANKGVILISESSWQSWVDGSHLRTRVPGRMTAAPHGRSRPLADLALS